MIRYASPMLTLPPGDFAAYLFDCDGTVVDSMPLHYLAWRQAVVEFGGEFGEELFYSWGGKKVADIIGGLNSLQGLSMPVEAVERRRAQLFQAMMPKLTAVVEVRQVIEAAHGRIPFALVSGGAREPVTASLTVVGLLDRFEVMVCAEDYARPKPDPQAFLLAAQLLAVPPESCLVFEDTEMGIQAATAAGMASVRVVTRVSH
jgi:HAD superfamily hydrolase (TIGR01509 family)